MLHFWEICHNAFQISCIHIGLVAIFKFLELIYHLIGQIVHMLQKLIGVDLNWGPIQGPSCGFLNIFVKPLVSELCRVRNQVSEVKLLQAIDIILNISSGSKLRLKVSEIPRQELRA